MKTIWRALALTACLAIAAPAGGALAAAGSSPPAAQLTDFSCDTAVQPLLRGMSVEAVMRPIPATRRLEMKAVLLRAYRRYGRYLVLHTHGFGRWVTPTDPTFGQRPGDVWNVAYQAVALPAPAFYRLRVTFRWYELGNRVLASATLISRVCHQLELRPDLVAGALTIIPASANPGEDRYVAVVRNRGLTGAGPFDVQVTAPLTTSSGVSSQTLGSPTVAWLKPHGVKRVSFLAAACTPGATLTLTVDPNDQVLDYDRANNVLQVTCPTPSGG